jgi:hypothetical protein
MNTTQPRSVHYWLGEFMKANRMNTTFDLQMFVEALSDACLILTLEEKALRERNADLSYQVCDLLEADSDFVKTCHLVDEVNRTK